MMKRASSLCAGLILLVTATSAAADCGWVLWWWSRSVDDGSRKVGTAYPSVEACIQGLDAREQGQQGEGWTTSRYTPTGPLYTWLVGEQIFLLTVFACLPDTANLSGSRGR